MKPKHRTDFDLMSRQGEAPTKVKSPKWTSNFTQDNRLFYLYLDMVRQNNKQK